MKKVLVSCLKGGVLVFVILSSGLALYIHYEGEDCDPVSEIQRLKQENRRDEALDMARFFGKNQRSNKEKIKELEERLEYTTFEKGKSFTWNGVIKGEVHDSYSGIGAKETVLSRKMSKGNICTPARHFSGGPARRSTGGPAHQVVKSVGLTLLFSSRPIGIKGAKLSSNSPTGSRSGCSKINCWSHSSVFSSLA